tara:strand:+ start:4609 stop:5256 length:648 start_codon:yes stop_codon:yes gene_type:complete
MAFILSAPSLIQLAMASNISPTVAWAWFVIVDGTILVATFSVLLLRKRSSRSVRIYPAIVLVAFGSLSIWANGVHGNNRPLSDVETFIVGSIAPIALLASTHLLVLILTSPDEGLSDAELVKIQKRIDREAQAAQVALTAPAAAQTPPAAKAVTATPAANLLSRDQAAERARKQFEQNNSWPTGAEIATWIGKSPKTGMRLLADLKREVDSGVSV